MADINSTGNDKVLYIILAGVIGVIVILVAVVLGVTLLGNDSGVYLEKLCKIVENFKSQPVEFERLALLCHEGDVL